MALSPYKTPSHPPASHGVGRASSGRQARLPARQSERAEDHPVPVLIGIGSLQAGLMLPKCSQKTSGLDFSMRPGLLPTQNPHGCSRHIPKPEDSYPVTEAGPAQRQGYRLTPSLTETSPTETSPVTPTPRVWSYHSITPVAPRHLSRTRAHSRDRYAARAAGNRASN